MKIDPRPLPTNIESEIKTELEKEVKSLTPGNVPEIPSGFPGIGRKPMD
jgi:hypothetical protein